MWGVVGHVYQGHASRLPATQKDDAGPKRPIVGGNNTIKAANVKEAALRKKKYMPQQRAGDIYGVCDGVCGN